jgi:hypothetical protein
VAGRLTRRLILHFTVNHIAKLSGEGQSFLESDDQHPGDRSPTGRSYACACSIH